MNLFNFFTDKDCAIYLKKREGEIKFGEKLQYVESFATLDSNKAKYVLFGIPEDIGVRANYGRAGTSQAWTAFLRNILNIQANSFTNPENTIILGEIDCSNQMQQAEKILIEDPHYAEKLGELVLQIDHKVSEVVKKIMEMGKVPIIIGGGHNNCYGNLKGTSEALRKKVNAINFDAHTDFRALEHRHSGNGFSYAFEDGYLDKYFIFGLHRNYTSSTIFETIEKYIARIKFDMFEDILVGNHKNFEESLKDAEDFCGIDDFGLEMDMDAIENMGSSAISPSGFTLLEARQFNSYFSKNVNCRYIHICEGSPKSEIFPNQVGKAIAYLVSDTINFNRMA